MFLTIAVVGIVVLLLTVGFAAAAHDPYEGRPQPPAVQVLDKAGPSHFFVDAARPHAVEGEVPAALLLARLEQHIRYEDAAVEAFLDAPERGTLYSQTSSSWVN